jgi:hypothetical protein
MPVPKPARPFGPVTGRELATLGLATPAQVRAAGWPEAFERWVEAFPGRLNVNAAVGILAAVDDVDWQSLAPARRAEARVVVEALRDRLRRR